MIFLILLEVRAELGDSLYDVFGRFLDLEGFQALR